MPGDRGLDSSLSPWYSGFTMMNEKISNVRTYVPFIVMMIWVGLILTGSQALFIKAYETSSYILFTANMMGLFLITFFAKKIE